MSSSSSVHRVAQTGFEHQTDAYERARPSYPDAALRWIFADQLGGAKQKLIVDLGAGTGKFTRLIQPFAEKILAVDPVPGMREKFKQLQPDIEIIDGAADRLPQLQSQSVDVVTCSQAFHWFATVPALREIHRVLKPGGRFVCIWNLEDRSRAAWVAALRDMYEHYEQGTPQYHQMKWRDVWFDPEVAALFRIPPVEAHFRNDLPNQTMSLIWDRVLSKSYVALLPESERASLHGRVEALLREHVPEFRSGNPNAVTFYPYGTHAVIATRL